MSHYTKCKTKLMNRSALLKALEDMGFAKSQVQIHDNPKQLEGYQGDLRQDAAEIILPRKYVGGAANDIGFKLQEDGTYAAIISEYDSGNPAARKNEMTSKFRGYNNDWLKKLYQRYSYHHLKEQLQDQGYYIESEREENGQIFMEVNTP